MRKVVPVGFLTMALTFAVPGAQAAAAPGVSCGDVVTSSVRLTEDLVCSGTALTVLGDGVYVDLAGHRLSAASEGAGTGLDVRADTVVKNGVVSGFETGVEVNGLAWPEPLIEVTLSQMTLEGAETGMVINDGRVTIRSSKIVGNDVGLLAYPADGDLRLFHTDVVDNRVGASVWTDNFRGGDFVGVYFARNKTALQCSRADILLSSSKLEDNETAFDAHECDGTLVTRTAFTRNGTGIVSYGTVYAPFVVEKNRFRNNDIGIRILDDESLVSIRDNFFYRNGSDVLDERG
jgi:hypothetical protein